MTSNILTKSANLDYIVSIEWMRYNEDWYPRKILFASVHIRDRKDFMVVPTEDSLISFTYNDIKFNKDLPQSPFWDETNNYRTKELKVPILEMKSFLTNDIYNILIDKDESGWPLNIATVDFSVYLYMKPLLPENVIFKGDPLNGDTRNAKLLANDYVHKASCEYRDTMDEYV